MNEGGSLDRDFWEAVWCWKFKGNTGNDEWDKCFWKLARQVGVILEEEGWPLKEAQLDRIATEKGWTKIRCNQPAMSSYIRGGDEKINCYLSTGTVGSCLNHPVQGKTQLFRRGMDMGKAALLFGNPREHTGRGYKRKASEPSRPCAACGRDKPCEAFSKNQRKKGPNAKCMTCVQGSR